MSRPLQLGVALDGFNMWVFLFLLWFCFCVMSGPFSHDYGYFIACNSGGIKVWAEDFVFSCFSMFSLWFCGHSSSICFGVPVAFCTFCILCFGGLVSFVSFTCFSGSLPFFDLICLTWLVLISAIRIIPLCFFWACICVASCNFPSVFPLLVFLFLWAILYSYDFFVGLISLLPIWLLGHSPRGRLCRLHLWSTPPLPVLFLLIHSYPSSLSMSPCIFVSVMVIMWLLCVLVAVFRLPIFPVIRFAFAFIIFSLLYFFVGCFCAGILLTCFNLFEVFPVVFFSMPMMSGWKSVLFSWLFVCIFVFFLSDGLPLFCCRPCHSIMFVRVVLRGCLWRCLGRYLGLWHQWRWRRNASIFPECVPFRSCYLVKSIHWWNFVYNGLTRSIVWSKVSYGLKQTKRTVMIKTRRKWNVDILVEVWFLFKSHWVESMDGS